MDLTRLPIACELFDEWQCARGKRIEPASRPFSRNWEELLERAGIVSATERNEAERDVAALAAEGWIEAKTVRLRPHLIDRVAIPLQAEARWREAFGFVPPSDEEARQIREWTWTPEMEFVRDAKLSLTFGELRQIDAFLKSGTDGRVSVPIKERSLEIFGDEKRLDQMLRSSAVFGEGRLTLEMLRCFVVPEPLPWAGERMPSSQSVPSPILVIENAATWHSYCQWNAKRNLFSAIVYGCGNRFIDSVCSLNDVFSAVGGVRRVFYFGDLDPQGLRIPQEASVRAQAAGLPAIEPHLWSYRQLLELGKGRAQEWEGDPAPVSLCDWLGELAEPARQILAANQRLPQEWVGWETLRHINGER